MHILTRHIIRFNQALHRAQAVRIVSISWLVILIMTVMTGCYRDDLCFLHPNGARIKIMVDYDSTEIEPDKSYIGIYDADTKELIREELMRSPRQHELYLQVGRYYLMVYNEPIIESDWATAHSVNIQNKSSWNTLRAVAADESVPPQTSANERIEMVVNLQDQLAVDRMIEFEVTPDMITQTHLHPTPIDNAHQSIETDTTLYFYPRRVFSRVDLNLEVVNYPGWTLRRNNGSRPQFIGAAKAYQMGSDTYSSDYTSQYMELRNGGTLFNSAKPTTNFYSSFFIVGLQNNTMPTTENAYPYSAFFRFEHGSASSATGIEIKPIHVNLVTGLNADLVSMTRTPAGKPHPKDGKVHPYDIIDINILLTLPERIPIGEDAEVDIEDWNEQDVPLDAPATLHFHPNGAVGTPFGWRYPVGTLLFLPAPTAFTAPSGYRFKHWNNKNDGSGSAFHPADPYTMPSGGGTLFAIYEKE